MYEDIEVLNRYGFEIVSEKGKRNRYYIDSHTFERPEIIVTAKYKDFDLSKYKRELFSMYSGESREISLIFPQELLNVALERFGETIKPIRYGSGEYLFTASIQVSNPFFGWIASFGGRVRIHSPEEVKGQYKEFIKDLEKSLEKR